MDFVGTGRRLAQGDVGDAARANYHKESDMTNQVDYEVALEVASHEAIIRQTYKDSVGVLTWSVGLTGATGHTVDRYINNPQPLQHCLNIYVWALRKYADDVDRAFAGHKLTKAQFAAALSFHWNTGRIGTAAWVKHWKAGRIADAKRAFMAWNKPKEIIGRREKERDLFFDGKWSNNGTMTEYTRLTKNMTPVWSSARKIDVSKELRAAFIVPTNVVVDKPAVAPAEAAGDVTLSPNHSPNALLVFALIAAVIAAGSWVWRKVTGKESK